MASSSTSKPKTAALTQPILSSFKPAKIFPDATKKGHSTTSLTFDEHGDTVLSCGDDETFKLWSCKTGKLLKTFYSKKYGIEIVRFTRAKGNILHTATKVDDTIRLQSMNTNEYITYFRGHTGRVTSMQTHPTDDGFISAARDSTVRLWDTRKDTCRGILKTGKDPVVAYDNTGKIFAIAHNDDRKDAVHLFDTSNFEGGSFVSFGLHDLLLSLPNTPRIPIITSLSFSPDGRFILVGTSDDVHYVLDSFEGHILRRLKGFQGLGSRDENGRLAAPKRAGSGQEVCWSPDGKYVLSGSGNGHIVAWDVVEVPDEGKMEMTDGRPTWYDCNPFIKTQCHAEQPIRAVAFNPRSAMFATAASDLAFWLPNKDLIVQPAI